MCDFHNRYAYVAKEISFKYCNGLNSYFRCNDLFKDDDKAINTQLEI